MIRARNFVALALAVSAVALVSTARAQTVAIEGAKVHVRPGETLEGATVLIRNGKIAAVGKDVRVPDGAVRIDARDKVVTAGLIDTYTTVGLVEVGLERQASEGTLPAGNGDDGVHAAYRAVDGYNPKSVGIPIARAGGITAVVTVPRGGLVSGASALMSTREGLSPETLAIRAPLAMHASLGVSALGSSHGSRAIAVERLREILDDARQYARRRAAYERNQTRPFAASRLDLDALVPVVQGRVPLFLTAHRASDLLAALRIAREMRLRLVLAGATEAWMVAGELARARVPVVLNPSANLPSTFDRLHVRDDAAALLRQAGVTVAVSPFGEAPSPWRLRQYAGLAAAHGLSWDDALASITEAPARIFGLRDRGVLSPGSVADVVVWSGDPLDVHSRALHVFVAGVEQPLETRWDLLLRRYRELPGR